VARGAERHLLAQLVRGGRPRRLLRVHDIRALQPQRAGGARQLAAAECALGVAPRTLAMIFCKFSGEAAKATVMTTGMDRYTANLNT
jgi:hypothetical protein